MVGFYRALWGGYVYHVRSRYDLWHLVNQTTQILDTHDVWHGLGKSVVFGTLITLVGVVNGASVTGGAEGVGRVTTNAVVHSILAIILADLVVVFMMTR